MVVAGILASLSVQGAAGKEGVPVQRTAGEADAQAKATAPVQWTACDAEVHAKASTPVQGTACEAEGWAQPKGLCATHAN
jgi:hypothetical protein